MASWETNSSEVSVSETRALASALDCLHAVPEIVNTINMILPQMVLFPGHTGNTPLLLPVLPREREKWVACSAPLIENIYFFGLEVLPGNCYRKVLPNAAGPVTVTKCEAECASPGHKAPVR
jgi:hypothetical protein